MTPSPGNNVFQDVSDTARWVAVYRALESERDQPLFRDPWARALAGERGEETVRRLGGGADLSWAVVVRTSVFDAILLRLLAGGGIGTVLNLAAGLDTRPYRVALPAALRWIEADLPATIAYKSQSLSAASPGCELQRVGLDLTDGAALNHFLDSVDETGREMLVLTEGLLVYLEAELVGALGRALAARPHIKYWLLDVAGPLALSSAYSRNLQDALDAAEARMRFAPAAGPEFFRSLGWRPVEVWSAWEQALRLERAPAWLVEVWDNGSPEQREAFRTIARYVVLAQDHTA
jgi:methyltransferase (TIGR00027 family)